MFPGAPTLSELFRLHARHHGALRRFAASPAGLWAGAAFRRTAREGIAVLAAMLRRLIHLLAREQVLPPLRVRTDPPPLAPAPRRMRAYRFRLHEAPPERWRGPPNPDPVPEPPELSRALFLARLDTLAAVYRARRRIARRLARCMERRIGAASPHLRRPALPPDRYPRLAPGFRAMLDFLDLWLDFWSDLRTEPPNTS